MSWDREGQSVSFKYLDIFPVSGRVSSSRVMYGGNVQHLVELDVPTKIWNSVRNYLLVRESELRRQQAVDAFVKLC